MGLRLAALRAAGAPLLSCIELSAVKKNKQRKTINWIAQDARDVPHYHYEKIGFRPINKFHSRYQVGLILEKLPRKAPFIFLVTNETLFDIVETSASFPQLLVFSTSNYED